MPSQILLALHLPVREHQILCVSVNVYAFQMVIVAEVVFGESVSLNMIFRDYDQLSVHMESAAVKMIASGFETRIVSMEGPCAVGGCNPDPSVGENSAGMKTSSSGAAGCPETESAMIRRTRWASPPPYPI